MIQDQWNHGLTTDVPAAAEALDRAFHAYYHFDTDILKQLDAAIEADPDFALPHAARGILLESLKKSALHPAVENALAAAKAARPPANERERQYIAALEAALAGNVTATRANSPTTNSSLTAPRLEILGRG